MKHIKINMKDRSKKTMFALGLLFLGKFSLEAMWSAIVALFGLFLLASISSFALAHPFLFAICIVAGWWLINEIDWEEK